MDILNSALSEEGQQPQVTEQATEQVAASQEQHQTTGEEAAPPAESQETREEPQAKGLQAALLAERRRRQELEHRSQELERLLAGQQQAKPQQQADDGAPDPAKYQDNPQQYWRDLARYEARQELKQAEEQRQQREREAAENQRLHETKAKLDAAVAKGQQKYRDFDAVINGGLAPFLTDAIREEIAASDVGDDVAYWLGKNPAEAHRLASLDGRALAREFARLETRVSKPPAPQIPQTLTQARDARGQFAQASYDGPTPLDAVLSRK